MLLWSIGLLVALVARPAVAASPYLYVPSKEFLEASPAHRYANMTNAEAYAELDRRGVPYRKVGKVKGVRAPVRLTGKLHGVHIHSSLPEDKRATSIFEMLDARLALTLDDFSALLERHDIVEVVHYTMYRPNLPKPGSKEEAMAKAAAKRDGKGKGASKGKRKGSPKGKGSSTRKGGRKGKPPASKQGTAAKKKQGKKGAATLGKGRKAPKHKSSAKTQPKKKKKGEPKKKGSAPKGKAPSAKAASSKPKGSSKGGSTKPSAKKKARPSKTKAAKASSSRGKKSTKTSKARRGGRKGARPGKGSRSGKNKPDPAKVRHWAPPGTRHPAGLAIDVGGFRKRDGRWISVAHHFRGTIGARTCGPTAKQGKTPTSRELRSIVCEASDLGLFTYVLTPNYDAPHADHFHMEIRGDVHWVLFH